MKTSIFRATTLRWAGLLAAILVWQPLHAALRFDTTTHQVDAQFGETVIRVVYPFVNGGDSPVRVGTIRTTCGCTTSELAKRHYEPGEGGEIEAVFTIGSRQGLQAKDVIVETDAGVHTLRLEVRIPQAWSVDNRLLAWTAATATAELQTRLVIYDPGITAVELLTNEGMWWTASLEPAADQPGVWWVRAKAKRYQPSARGTVALRLRGEGRTDILAQLYLRCQ
jgi:hypothetical protein